MATRLPTDYDTRREALATYFDSTARQAWIDLTSDAKVSADYVRNHIHVGIESLRLIRRHGKSVRHLRFDE